MSRVFDVGSRVGVIFVWPSDYDLPGPLPLRKWLFAREHDSGSWWWRVCGFEINIPRGGTHV